MDFKDTTKEAEFRKKCHDWLDANAPKKDSDYFRIPKVLDK